MSNELRQLHLWRGSHRPGATETMGRVWDHRSDSVSWKNWKYPPETSGKSSEKRGLWNFHVEYISWRIQVWFGVSAQKSGSSKLQDITSLFWWRWPVDLIKLGWLLNVICNLKNAAKQKVGKASVSCWKPPFLLRTCGLFNPVVCALDHSLWHGLQYSFVTWKRAIPESLPKKGDINVNIDHKPFDLLGFSMFSTEISDRLSTPDKNPCQVFSCRDAIHCFTVARKASGIWTWRTGSGRFESSITRFIHQTGWNYLKTQDNSDDFDQNSFLQAF